MSIQHEILTKHDKEDTLGEFSGVTGMGESDKISDSEMLFLLC